MRLPVGEVMAVHDGPEAFVFGVLASFVRHRLAPPARIRFGLLGSRTNGAMNSAFPFIASGIWKGTFFHAQAVPFQNCPLMYSELTPPLSLRCTLRLTYSPYT